MPRRIGNNHYECRKCGERFIEPEEINHKFGSGDQIKLYMCPSCKSRSFVEIKCAYCDFYKSRSFPCGMGYRTIVPFSIACWEFKVRSLNKSKVV